MRSFIGAHFFILEGMGFVEIYRIAFIGHRRICKQWDLIEKIEQIAKSKLCEKEYVEFYIGRNGDLDILAASAVKRAQDSVGHQNSRLILLQPYKMKDDEYYEKFYDEVWYPISPSIHPKAAITKRNQWMTEHADLLVAYVETGRKGGAQTALHYAEKHGVEIIHLNRPSHTTSFR